MHAGAGFCARMKRSGITQKPVEVCMSAGAACYVFIHRQSPLLHAVNKLTKNIMTTKANAYANQANANFVFDCIFICLNTNTPIQIAAKE